MDVTKTGNQFAAPIAGDGGEAMELSDKSSSLSCVSEQCENSEIEAVMPNDAGWYVAVVRCNCEMKIADAIKADFDERCTWFEYWVPMQKVWYIDKRTKKRRSKEKVLLTTFIFCHVSPNRLDDIRFRSDVYKMLTMPGQRAIYRISDKELNNYRRIVENPDLPITPCTGPLRKGQRVRITEGGMAGVEAYVQRISGKKVTIGNEIKFISGATIEIDRGFLEAITEE